MNARIIVCGGRDYPSDLVERWLERHWWMKGFAKVEMFMEGGATGADTGARIWAIKNLPSNCRHTEPAEWDRFKLNAGPIRNMKMFRLCRPNVLIAFPGGSGTANMVKIVTDYNASVSTDQIKIIRPLDERKS